MAQLSQEQKDIAIAAIIAEREEAVDIDELTSSYLSNEEQELRDLDNESLIEEYEGYVGPIEEIL